MSLEQMIFMNWHSSYSQEFKINENQKKNTIHFQLSQKVKNGLQKINSQISNTSPLKPLKRISRQTQCKSPTKEQFNFLLENQQILLDSDNCLTLRRKSCQGELYGNIQKEKSLIQPAQMEIAQHKKTRLSQLLKKLVEREIANKVLFETQRASQFRRRESKFIYKGEMKYSLNSKVNSKRNIELKKKQTLESPRQCLDYQTELDSVKSILQPLLPMFSPEKHSPKNSMKLNQKMKQLKMLTDRVGSQRAIFITPVQRYIEINVPLFSNSKHQTTSSMQQYIAIPNNRLKTHDAVYSIESVRSPILTITPSVHKLKTYSPYIELKTYKKSSKWIVQNDWLKNPKHYVTYKKSLTKLNKL